MGLALAAALALAIVLALAAAPVLAAVLLAIRPPSLWQPGIVYGNTYYETRYVGHQELCIETRTLRDAAYHMGGLAEKFQVWVGSLYPM